MLRFDVDTTPVYESTVYYDALSPDYSCPYNTGTWRDIEVCRVFERLTPTKASGLMADVESLLEVGGRLSLIVAKHDEALAWTNLGPANAAKFFGPRPYSRHITKYSEAELIKFVESHGLVYEASYKSQDVPYPHFGLVFRKPQPLAARDYAIDDNLRARLKDMSVLEIGPGRFPLPEAKFHVDINPEFLDAFPADRRLLANIEDGLPFADKQFDYVYCAHVLEHTEDPVQAAKEISRVAKEGLIIMPSAYKEFLFGYEESDHLWEIFPPNAPNQPILFRGRNPELVGAFSKDYQSAMCSTFRTGRYDSNERKVLRKWYRENEAKLDVIVHWKDSFEVKII